jgi:hypothetical protein
MAHGSSAAPPGQAPATTTTSPSQSQNGASRFSPFPIGGPTTKAWREQALTRVAELATQARLQRYRNHELADQIEGHLEEARDAAKNGANLRSAIGGAPLERAASNLDAAEADLLRLLPISDVHALMPSLQAHVDGHLDARDPRRTRFDEIAEAVRKTALPEGDRETVAAAHRAASSEARREVVRVRSFRNVLLVAAALLALAAGGLAVLGVANPDVIPLCFAPDEQRVVCPTAENPLGDQNVEAVTRTTTSSWDLPLIEMVGLVAAAVAAAASLSGIKGTSVPYSLPVALSLLKLPTGALTAVLGLLLMRGEFIPGLSALDSSGQIVAWAVVFGAAQHIFTRMVDQQAQTVLEGVGSASASSPAASR